MPNIIGYKDLSNLYIKPAAEPTRTTLDINLKSASEPERVLNPIVSESYMRQYIEEHGGITPTGNIEITENGENINVAPYATATVNVSGGGGGDFTTAQVTIINPTENNYALPIPNAHEQQGMRPAMTVNNITVPANDSVNVVVPLYYNACYISLAHNEGSFASCTGDLTINSSIDLFIKGDGTVTLASL